jgi:hypothetical protein
MKAKITLIILTAIVLTACKKTYTCTCSNPGGVFKIYEIKDTRKKATEECNDYSKEYQTIPWSESGCSLD